MAGAGPAAMQVSLAAVAGVVGYEGARPAAVAGAEAAAAGTCTPRGGKCRESSFTPMVVAPS